jgi:glycosyltransferase involved in cell wall biosynthesis
MFLRLADIVTTPSVNLVRKFKRFNKRNVMLFPNGLDMNIWGGAEKKHEDKKELRILWTLSSSHLGDWLQLEKPLSVVLNRNPFVKLVTVGEKFNSKHIHPKKREHHTWLPSVDKYAEFIKGLNCDIGIGHVNDERFNIYKSPLKACEYGALGMCAVLQGRLYGKYFNENEAVVYYKKGEFVTGLQKVINDFDLRQKLAYNLSNKVKENYTLEVTGKALENELLRVISG